MNHRFMRRTGAALAVFVAALASANAFTIDLQSRGTVTPGPFVTYAESVVFQTSSIPTPGLTNLNYAILNSPPPTGGSGTFSNVGGDTLLFSALLQSVSANFVGVSGAGIWTYTGGTGGFAGLSGGGTFAFNVNASTGASYSTFIGQLEPVPEPASMAALGVGLVGVFARRRRK